MPDIAVHPVTSSGLSWSFRNGTPHWRSHGWHGISAEIDPFPAYGHDMDEVRAAVDRVQASWPPNWDVDLFAADREEVGRSNGFSSLYETGHYEDRDGVRQWVKEPPRGIIFLCGKRTPIHPAVTRYLVAHEYGHNVEYMLNVARGAESAHSDELRQEYAAVRGLGSEVLHHGEGGVWHDAIGEIFACDFRILVCEAEVEFWPHPGIARPEDVSSLPAWWGEARATLEAHGREQAAA